MIGLLTKPGGFAADALVACGGLPLAAVDVADFGLPPYHCPYGLPSIKSGHTVIVVSSWLHSLQQQGVNVVNQVLMPLRDRFQRIIGLDHSSPFLLCLPDEEVALMDVVLKINGVYQDCKMNNFSNLIGILDDIECNFRNYVDVAAQGHQDWLAWSRDIQVILRQGFTPLYGR